MKTTVLNFVVVACAALFTGLPAATHADTLDMRSVGDSPASGVLRPQRGVSMDAVRNRYGAPAETINPVGEPPITRWIYQDYTVYFEHDRVIHSVVHEDLRASTHP